MTYYLLLSPVYHCIYSAWRFQRRSIQHASFFLFNEQPRPGNSDKHVYFSHKLERFLGQQTKPIHVGGEHGKMHSNWLVADTGAGCTVISDPKLLKQIRTTKNGASMTIFCNTGKVTTRKIGFLLGYGTVWFNPKGITNIISISEAAKRCRIIMDTHKDNAILIHPKSAPPWRFQITTSGLYCCDARMLTNKSSASVHAITTVEKQEQYFSDLDVRRAREARKLQHIMGFISNNDLLRVLDNNTIKDCPVQRHDVTLATEIYGTSSYIRKEKTVREQPNAVHEDTTSEVPSHILRKYKNVTLHADIMAVNGILFFIAISRHLQFISVKPIPNKKKESMLHCIELIKDAYSHRGFTVKAMRMDNEFNCIKSDLAKSKYKIRLNLVAPGEHEPHIERCIRHVKERCRCTYAAINFKRLPKRLVSELLLSAVYWINAVPGETGVYPIMSPLTILTGAVLSKKNVMFQFGEYVQATTPSLEEGARNNMQERTQDAIYTRPSGNS